MVQIDLRSRNVSSITIPNTQGKEIEIDATVRNYLMEAAKGHTYTLSTYKDTLRTLISFFGRFTIVDGEGKVKKVSSIYARPERAIAKAVDETKSLILPIISVYQTGSQPANQRSHYMSTLVHEKYWDEKSGRAVRLLSFTPKPINLIYQASIWAKYREDLDQLSSQISFSFNPSIEIPTKQSTLVKAFILSENDMSPTDVPDMEDRILRKAFTIQVETYLEGPKFLYTATGKIERVVAETEIYKKNISDN